VRPTASPNAKDFFIELPRRDTSRLLKKATARKEAGTYADSSPSGLPFPAGYYVFSR
jgi:hypothetical protein